MKRGKVTVKLAIGQRVAITGKHPWRGNAGEVVETDIMMGTGIHFDARVKLDNGFECCADCVNMVAI